MGNCDWEGALYYRYMPFNGASEIIKAAKDEDVCLVVGGLQFLVADIDNSKHIDRCEFSLMCIGTSGFGEVDTSEWTQRPKRVLPPGRSSERVAPSTPSPSDGRMSRRPAPTENESFISLSHDILFRKDK